MVYIAASLVYNRLLLLLLFRLLFNAVITIAIRLRYDYDPTIRRIARARFQFDASKK